MTDYLKNFKAASSRKSPPQVVTVAADDSSIMSGGSGGVAKKIGLPVNSRGSLGIEDYEGIRQNVLSGVIISGIEVGGSSSEVKAETKQKFSGGKASDKKTLFYLKDAPGATICCVSVSSSAGGQKACGEKKDSVTNLCDIALHRSLVPIDKLQFPALYCRCKKMGRGGETFYWDSMSHVKFSELPSAKATQLLGLPTKTPRPGGQLAFTS